MNFYPFPKSFIANSDCSVLVRESSIEVELPVRIISST